MKKNSKAFALVLALLMLSQAAACSQSGTNNDDETKGGTPSESTNENGGSSSSDEETDPSSEEKTDSDVRTRMHSGLIGAILGGSGGIAVMLGVILWMKEKFGHHSDRFS